jgi:hypothetical protein
LPFSLGRVVKYHAPGPLLPKRHPNLPPALPHSRFGSRSRDRALRTPCPRNSRDTLLPSNPGPQGEQLRDTPQANWALNTDGTLAALGLPRVNAATLGGRMLSAVT